jgi:riboflavin kinase / FMN adenylyltransferase
MRVEFDVKFFEGVEYSQLRLLAETESLTGGAITIGNFDGVHLGHRLLLSEIKKESIAIEGPSIVLTFDPPPLRLLRPDACPPALMSMNRRRQAIAKESIDAMVVLKTSHELLSLSAESFFHEILVDSFGIRSMAEGPNFHFGKDRRGDIELLDELCQNNQIKLKIVDGLMLDQHWVSSSRIRSLIAAGDVSAANQLLVEPYRIAGLVGHGAARGRTIGFPTANLTQTQVLLPPLGVYAGEVFYDGTYYAAAIHIGPNPTFSENTPKIEVHLIEFQGELYDQEIEVRIFERLRGIEKFAGVDALVAQLKIDVERSRSIFLDHQKAISHPR